MIQKIRMLQERRVNRKRDKKDFTCADKKRREDISMTRRFFSIFLAVVMLAGCAEMGVLRLGTEVYAAEIRGGYQLTPEKEDDTGVKIDSSFVLTGKDMKVNAEEVKTGLQITPTVPFTAEQQADGVKIILQEKLKENSIYAFAFKEATWLFQTETEFSLQGVMPAHQATGVPLDSGIEFLFSAAGAAQLDKYIEITPKLDGKFEQRENLTVFVPSQRLKPKTVYTVLVKAGLPLAASGKTLKADRVFQFETANKESIFGDLGKYEYLDFSTWQNEIGPADHPRLEMQYYSSEKSREEKIKIHLDVYRFDKAEDYIKALSRKANIPNWTRYADDLTDKANLRKAASLDQILEQEEDGWGYQMELPLTLPAGYYLLEAQKDKCAAQTFLQVTDISSYYRRTDTQDVLWLHQVKTGNLLAGVEVVSFETTDEKGEIIRPKEIERTKTDQDGLALLSKKAMGPVALLLRSGQMEAVMYYRPWNYEPLYWCYFGLGRGSGATEYWKVMQLDRNLYQPLDQVGIFGFVAPRYEKGGNIALSREERIKKSREITAVTAEITQNYWYFYDYPDKSLVYARQELPVKDGFYSGEIALPNLAEGRYQLRIKLGDVVLQTRYFQVENYVKPAYKITLEKDKEAIFWNEAINFTTNTQFFEGTPVSNLDFHYAVYGQSGKDGSGQTDAVGKAQFTYQPVQSKSEGTIAYCEASVSATLPESGEISGRERFRVFLKDAVLSAEANKEGNQGTLSGVMHSITLERLNNGTAKGSSDYLDQPLAGHKLTVRIYRNKWNKIEVGQHYDYINKVVVKEYQWRQEKSPLETKELMTDAAGKFEYKRTLPKEEDVYYTADIFTEDQSGNPIRQDLYFWSGRDWYSYRPADDGFELMKDKDAYQIGDTAQLRLMNQGKTVTGKKVLYLTAQSGLRRAFVDDGQINLPYTAQEAPRLDVAAVIFGGYAAEEVARGQILYDTKQAKLEIKATTDKESYRPGEEVKVLLEVKDMAGKPAISGKVHLKAIDEALLALSEKEEDILQELYRSISSGLGDDYTSHGVQQNFLDRNGSVDTRMAPMAMAEEKADMTTASKEMKPKTSNSIRVREKFLDTAVFRLVDLDENGKAVMSFPLPDNVTSWRVMLSALTDDLQAGSGTQNLKVSLPFFISASLNTEYLQGDQLTLGVTGYGSELKADTIIEYQAFVGDKLAAKASGKAFERVNLDLPAFQTTGEVALRIEARAGNGLADALGYKLKVLATYHQRMVSRIMAAEQGMKLPAGEKGMTTVCFIDRRKSKYIPALYEMNYYFGERIDQRLTAKLAAQLLKDIQGKDADVNLLEDVKVSDYQTENGGIAILPYAEDDLEITVQMLPLLIDPADSSKDLTNRRRLEAYLTAKLKERVSAKALYGLAVLHQPILEKLTDYDRIENLSLEERLYTGLAYAELGDIYRAKQIYEQYAAPQLEVYDTIASLRQGDKEKSYRLTGTAMLLAQKVGNENAVKMFRFETDNSSKYYFNGAQKLCFIKEELKQGKFADSRITYAYLGQEKEEKLEAYPVSFRLPSVKLNELEIKAVSGNVDVVLTYPQTEQLKSSPDKYLQLERKYFVDDKETTEFKEGDIVKVELTWDISLDAPEGSYRITDYLPAGLKPIQKDFSFLRNNYYGSWWWQDIDQQKVSIYVGYWRKDLKPVDRTHIYYARVVSPGEYKAEAPVMQGIRVKDHIFVGRPEKVKILRLK